MEIIEDVRRTERSFEDVVLTIGCFDGVHRGHQKIIQTLMEHADDRKGTAAVMVMEPNPRHYFSSGQASYILTDLPQKARLLEALGVAVLYILPFDEETVTMSPQDFIEKILVERCQAKAIVIGHDFTFGYQAQGNYNDLKQAAQEHGFQLAQVPPLIINGERVSSTLIRERVALGEVEAIDVYLGRSYSLHGTVISGQGIGSTLGFPTANIDIGAACIPAHGVYASEAYVKGTHRKAAVNIGIAPTIRGSRPLVEAHLLDFEENLVGADLEIIFHKRLRPEKKFPSREALVEAIGKDVAMVRAMEW
ncbi:MAG: bifunctional riboflavin kinase/FAD synthetase [Candidatus Hydrogenedentes bacterium]|nr:bifunctional riboflavin kinase/FAD synthetase [Candidatus Hydrogenedentota bacterium]